MNKEEIRQVRVVNIPRKIKINSGNDISKYELDVVPIHTENGKIIEGDMETIIVPEEIIMEMMYQAREFFEGKIKEGKNSNVHDNIMYG